MESDARHRGCRLFHASTSNLVEHGQQRRLAVDYTQSTDVLLRRGFAADSRVEDTAPHPACDYRREFQRGHRGCGVERLQRERLRVALSGRSRADLQRGWHDPADLARARDLYRIVAV